MRWVPRCPRYCAPADFPFYLDGPSYLSGTSVLVPVVGVRVVRMRVGYLLMDMLVAVPLTGWRGVPGLVNVVVVQTVVGVEVVVDDRLEIGRAHV